MVFIRASSQALLGEAIEDELAAKPSLLRYVHTEGCGVGVSAACLYGHTHFVGVSLGCKTQCCGVEQKHAGYLGYL